MASTGSFLPTGENSAKMHHGKQHYGLPVHGAGLSFHEKTLLGLMGWWMAMNFIGIIYALMAVDFRGDGMFQKETPQDYLKKLLPLLLELFHLAYGVHDLDHSMIQKQIRLQKAEVNKVGQVYLNF